MGFISKLASSSSKELAVKIIKLNKEISDAKKVKGIKGAKEEFKLKDKSKPIKKEMQKKLLKNLQIKLDKAKEVKQKKKIEVPKKSSKVKLDPTPSSPRSAIVQAQRYKKVQSGLEKEYTNTLDKYNKLKDKKSEAAMLMFRNLNLMSKKIKGKKSIPMLPQDKNKGGMVKSKPTTYKGGVLNGHGKDYGKPGGYNMGGLAAPTAKQTGLKKLPTDVRNKMGYMYGGGMAKNKSTSMDYRKGGLVIMITGGNTKMKKGKK
jgi:hypothetical protein